MYQLAQFPLQLVAFPGEEVNLHIFEDRYKQLIKDCLAEDMEFGIVPYVKDEVQSVGTSMRLIEIENEYEDGRLDIRTLGISQYEILEFYPQAEHKLYASAIVKPFPIKENSDETVKQGLSVLVQELYALMQINAPIADADLDNLSITHKLRLELAEEYKILAMDNQREKQKYLIQILERVMPSVREAADLRRKIQMNGQYKHIIPPDIS